MVIVSKIKKFFGEDINEVNKNILSEQAKLLDLLEEDPLNDVEITYTRGRLLVYLRQAIDLSTDENAKQYYKKNLNTQLKYHIAQLKSRIQKNKKAPDGKLSTEIGLKIKKTVASYKKLPVTEEKEFAPDAARSVLNTVSTVGSFIKFPAIVVTKIIKETSSLTAGLITLPLRVPDFLLCKIVDPDSKYNGGYVSKMSDGLENLIQKAMEGQERAIRRI